MRESHLIIYLFALHVVHDSLCYRIARQIHTVLMSAYAALNLPRKYIPRFPAFNAKFNELITELDFVFTPDNAIFAQDAIILGLDENEHLLIYGFYEFTVLRGDFVVDNLYTAENNKKYPVVTTSLDCLPVISCAGKSQGSILPKKDAVIKIENLQTGLDNFHDYGHTVFPKFFYKQLSNHTFKVVTKRDLLDSLIGTCVDSSIRKVVENVTSNMCKESKNPSVVITGSKTTGKSTLSALIANSVLFAGFSEVVYMDLDPAISPFSPPGVMSLVRMNVPVFGSQWSRQLDPECSHYYGFSSPLTAPDNYMRIFLQLLRHYEANFKGVPLVVNTSGLIKGYGREIIGDICSYLSTKDLVFLNQNEQNTSLDDSDEESPEYIDATIEEARLAWSHVRFHVTRAYRRNLQLRKSDLTDMANLLYFHSTGPNTWLFASHLLKESPRVLSYGPKNPTILGIVSLHDNLVRLSGEETVLFAEASLMALCAVKTETSGLSFINSKTYSTLDPVLITLCLVHSISTKTKTINVYFPSHNGWTNRLEKAVGNSKLVLVRGEGQVPGAEVQAPMFTKATIPYVVPEPARKLGGVWKIRRNLGRKNQQK